VGKKIAMIVNNPCAPDTRVTKEAESLTKYGYQVRVFCKTGPGLPVFETQNGVEYYRIEFSPMRVLTDMIFFWKRKRAYS